MKSTLYAFLFVTLLSPLASADLIRCTFTEPFLTTTYNFSDRTFTIMNPFPRTFANHKVEQNVTVVRDVSFRPSGDRQFVLLTKSGELLQRLKVNGKGSDGMSDQIYPIDGEWITNFSSNGKLYGGCEFTAVKK